MLLNVDIKQGKKINKETHKIPVNGRVSHRETKLVAWGNIIAIRSSINTVILT